MFKKIAILCMILALVFVIGARNPGAWDTIRRMLLSVPSHMIPDTDDARDVGSTGKNFRNYFMSGDFTLDTASWFGLGAAKCRELFVDTAVDEFNLVDCFVQIGDGTFSWGNVSAAGDVGIEGKLEVDGATYLDSLLSVSGVITGLVNSIVLTNTEGVHDGGNNVAIMADSSESFGTNSYVGMTIYNNTDGSSGVITANDGTTITAPLSGGTDDDWDTNDTWAVAPGPRQSGSLFYIGSATTILHNATANYVAGYYSTGANVIKIDPQSGSMQITLNGTPTGTNGEEIDSSGAAGDFIWIHNQSATVAVTQGRSGLFIDGGAS